MPEGGFGRIGWHMFLQSRSTLLQELDIELKVQPALLRRADTRAIMNNFTEAVRSTWREENSKVVRLAGHAHVA